jgi:ABC-type transporter Mla MlaB component
LAAFGDGTVIALQQLERIEQCEEFAMLRITTDENSQGLTLRLEGRLEGPWVTVLTQCRDAALPRLRGRRLCVDLNGVTFVDAQGKARLAEMHGQGAELLGEDIETQALVAEIRAGRVGSGDDEPKRVSRKTVFHGTERLTELQRLQAELHEVNEKLVQAARPLERLPQMSVEQRQKVADQIREKLARWESVTREIQHVMGTSRVNSDNEDELL